MRALITGGAGFIGSHLAEELLRRGADVSVIDDLSTGSIENIGQLKGLRGFSYTIDTIQNRPVMAELADGADVIYHLAAAVGVRLIIESPVRTIETNIKGTELVLELAAKKRKKVVLASTSEVYGKANSLPFSESGDIVLGRRVPRARVLEREAGPRSRCPTVQYCGASSDGTIRNGHPELRQTGASWRADHGLR